VDDLQILFMIPHHYGMFDFNIVDLNDLKKKLKNRILAVWFIMQN
jgi:hypothetical protein